MFIPDTALATVPAGEYPPTLRAACEVCEVKPEQLMSWAVKKDEVIVILPDGRKVKFMVIGDWVNPLLLWMVDSPPAAEHLPQVGAFELPEEPALPVKPVKRSPGKGK